MNKYRVFVKWKYNDEVTSLVIHEAGQSLAIDAVRSFIGHATNPYKQGDVIHCEELFDDECDATESDLY